jgi:hypothetical protein
MFNSDKAGDEYVCVGGGGRGGGGWGVGAAQYLALSGSVH